ncbi:MAG: restriction endonuclease, partial [Deltaproteobacteria bacterium]|nr:restriction endonuclease [Deltaproteobacteria bacterium]
MSDEKISVVVNVTFDADNDPAVCETLCGLADVDRPERVRQWARLGHLVMSMARVAPGKEALREYLSDFSRDTEELRRTIQSHLEMFRQKTTRADGDLGERFVREQLFDAFKEDGDTFEVWSSTGHQGDLVGRMAAQDRPPRRILVEVKDYTHPVPSGEVDKFRRDLRENTDMQAGIFVSLRTPITGIPGRVRMDVEDGRPVVYVAQEAAGQQLFVVAWAMLRGLLDRAERPAPAGLQDL